MSGQRVSVAERMLKGRKHFSRNVRSMVSVTVSKLGKTDLVFVPPGAKINSVYYCENVLEQVLLPVINSPYLEQRLRVQAGLHTVHTTLSLTCVPMCLRSLNQKTGRQTVRIKIPRIIQCGQRCCR